MEEGFVGVVWQGVRGVPHHKAQMAKNLTWLRSPGFDPLFPLSREDPQKGMATHSNIFAWRIPWTEWPGGLQFMGLQRVGHNSVADTHTHRKHVGSYFPDQGLNLCPLQWKLIPPDYQGVPKPQGLEG